MDDLEVYGHTKS